MSLFDFDFGELKEIAKPDFVEFHRDEPDLYAFCISKSLIVGFGDSFILVDDGKPGFTRFSVYETFDEIANILGVTL